MSLHCFSKEVKGLAGKEPMSHPITVIMDYRSDGQNENRTRVYWLKGSIGNGEGQGIFADRGFIPGG